MVSNFIQLGYSALIYMIYCDAQMIPGRGSLQDSSLPLTYHYHSLSNFPIFWHKKKNVPGSSSTFPAYSLEPTIPLINLTPRFHLMDI